ncbi:MAG: phage portal protein [Clostridia bacterium]|nr:phage portal protein [Clostridia bacterium]
MDINKIKRIILNDSERRRQIAIEKRYYENDNMIRDKGILPDNTDPMRNADNRVSHNFHQLITDEKVSYMFTNPVLFDVQDKNTNKQITETLGDDFKSESAYLCTNATNNKVSWLHYWIEDNRFQYAVVETEQCKPVFDGKLKKKLIGFYRYYEVVEEDERYNIKPYVIFEFWDNKHCEKYKFKGNLSGTGLTYMPETYEEFEHDLGEVPFIEFKNNRNMISDLYKYKDQIDIYDKVMSGYANDLEDIQQLIYILENYGGEDLKEFLGELKRFKTVKTETGADGKTNGGLKTLSIEIPVEARNSILEILKKQIYESGQALQQDNEDFGNASGVALKFFYRKLELKAGLTQVEFEKGFAKLVRAIMKFLNISNWETKPIIQTWTRNMISNDLENAQIAVESKDIISDETIIKNHPWVEEPEDEIQKVKEQKEETQKRQQELFANAGGFNNNHNEE